MGGIMWDSGATNAVSSEIGLVPKQWIVNWDRSAPSLICVSVLGDLESISVPKRNRTPRPVLPESTVRDKMKTTGYDLLLTHWSKGQKVAMAWMKGVKITLVILLLASASSNCISAAAPRTSNILLFAHFPFIFSLLLQRFPQPFLFLLFHISFIANARSGYIHYYISNSVQSLFTFRPLVPSRRFPAPFFVHRINPGY